MPLTLEEYAQTHMLLDLVGGDLSGRPSSGGKLKAIDRIQEYMEAAGIARTNTHDERDLRAESIQEQRTEPAPRFQYRRYNANGEHVEQTRPEEDRVRSEPQRMYFAGGGRDYASNWREIYASVAPVPAEARTRFLADDIVDATQEDIEEAQQSFVQRLHVAANDAIGNITRAFVARVPEEEMRQFVESVGVSSPPMVSPIMPLHEDGHPLRGIHITDWAADDE